MVCLDTLRIKYLPKELSEAQKEDFVRHFGAVKVKVITSKAKATSVVYAKFENQDIAKNVLFRLHQLNVLNCILCVEYAETDILQGALTNKKIGDSKDAPDQKFLKNFITNINAFNDSVGFHQPPPSHLKYSYPKANRSTINNIAHALATVPRFYTQVLHLMNKMNLPPPFAMPEPPVRLIQPLQQPAVVQKQQEVLEKKKESSSESELESDGESNKTSEVVPQKRKLPQKKVVKRPKFIKTPVVQSSVSSKPVEKPENVFEKVEVQTQKKIELRVMPELPPDPPKKEPSKKDALPHTEPPANSKPSIISAEPNVLEQAKQEQNIKSKMVETPKKHQKSISVTPVSAPVETKVSIDKKPKHKIVEPVVTRREQEVKPQVEQMNPSSVRIQSTEPSKLLLKSSLQEQPIQNQDRLANVDLQRQRQETKESLQPLQQTTTRRTTRSESIRMQQKVTLEEQKQQKQDPMLTTPQRQKETREEPQESNTSLQQRAPERPNKPTVKVDASEGQQKVNLEEVKHPQNEIVQELEKISREPEEANQSLQQVKPMETSEVIAEPTSPEDEYPCISLEELAANQITDLTVMPVFKNYTPGEPTNKLYIKNCAKTVAVQDLEYIYNRYREEGTEDKPSEFNIRLMQEGRMKGQAFVTLDSIEMAQKAVRETNGFILKDKPLVVVFGKAGKKK